MFHLNMAISATIKEVQVHVGDIIRVHNRVVEGNKERVQIFEGMLLGIRGRGDNRTFTVRKIASGNIGVERIFPVISPWIVKMEVKKKGQVRRAKLNYVRKQSSRQMAKITAGGNSASTGGSN